MTPDPTQPPKPLMQAPDGRKWLEEHNGKCREATMKAIRDFHKGQPVKHQAPPEK